MKKAFFILFLFISTFPVFTQRYTTVGIIPFEASGAGVSAGDAREVTELVIAELRSWGTLGILSGGEAESAPFIVRGQITRENNQIVLNATTYDARSGNPLNTSSEQAPTLGALSMASFCAQLVENVPFPNYLLGRWQSIIDTIDGPLTCILEFRPDRTVHVERYDTWEHNGTNSLRYQGIGSGTYTYAGYSRRTITLGNRQILADATVSINLTLEDALPKFNPVNAGGLRILFNNDRNGFELVHGGLPCGENHSGPSIYPGTNVFYTIFTKIQ
jgi:hypothetical protein